MANVALAPESGLQGTVRMHDADFANLPKHSLPDPKMHQDPPKGAIRARDADMRDHFAIYWGSGRTRDGSKELS